MSAHAIQGFIDHLSATSIHGWAHDPANPLQPLSVTIYVGDKFVATLKADRHRPDLQQAGFGDGRKAFAFDPAPHLSTEPQTVRIVYSSTGETIPNGRAELAKTVVTLAEDWDHQLAPLDPHPAMERVRQFPEERWPLISVIIPNYNTPAKYVELAVRSVLTQDYPRWEICIADNKSTDQEVLAYLHSLEGSDPRIKLKFRDFNGGISASTNSAIELATGEYCALLDADDELTRDALAEIAASILEQPETDVLYTDQDKIDEQGQRFEPFHKPAWSPVFFLGVMYVCHLLVARTTLIRKIGGCDSRFDKVQDFDLMVRLGELTERIAHIPKILYHWRTLPGSLASASNAKDAIGELQTAVVNAHLQRRRLPITAIPHPVFPHRVQLDPQPRTSQPKISILMPSACNLRFLGQAVPCIFERSIYPDIELILIVNEIRWQVPEQAAFLEQCALNPRIKIIRYPDQPYNFSLYNNWAARQATGDILVLCNDDIEVATPDWMERLLMHLEIPGVAATGPLLTYPNGAVQHSGVVLGFRGTADHVMRHYPGDADGYAGSLSCSREVSALTAACLMLRKDDYWAVGGMRESLATLYNDLDLCLRLRRRGGVMLQAANVRMIHHESVSRGSFYDQLERALILDAYGDLIAAGDPYYNRNFTRNSPDYRLRTA